MRRVVVIGSSGAGKTNLAAALAARLGVPHVELDSLFWGPNWTALGGTPEGDARFRARIVEATVGDGWVVDGNYSSVAPGVLWPRADTIVWLDYPLPLVFLRLLWRSIRRAATRELLWGTNRERFRELFLAKDSLLLYLLRTHRARRRRFSERLAQPHVAHATVVRLRSPAVADAWLRNLLARRRAPAAAATTQAVAART